MATAPAARIPLNRSGAPVPVALATALMLVPGAAAAVTADELAGMFGQVCLEHLPDFSGREVVLEGLGFTKDGERYEQGGLGESIVVSIRPPDETIGYSCTLSATLSRDDAITPVLSELIAEMTGNRFHHTGIPVRGTRAETFNWRLGELEVLVIVSPDGGPSRFVSVTTGESDR